MAMSTFYQEAIRTCLILATQSFVLVAVCAGKRMKDTAKKGLKLVEQVGDTHLVRA